jgi:hypothetical protein
MNLQDFIFSLLFFILASLSGIIVTEAFRWGYNKTKNNKK